MCVICARRTTVGRGARGGVPTRASHDRHMTGVAGARRRLLWVWGAGCWGCKAPAIVGVGRRLLGVQGAGCWGCRDMMCHVCVRVTAGGKWPPVTPVSELCCPPLSAVAAAATVAAVSCSRCRHRCCRCYVTAVTTAALPPLPLLHHCRCRTPSTRNCRCPVRRIGMALVLEPVDHTRAPLLLSAVPAVAIVAAAATSLLSPLPHCRRCRCCTTAAVAAIHRCAGGWVDTLTNVVVRSLLCTAFRVSDWSPAPSGARQHVQTVTGTAVTWLRQASTCV
jgi:hypothetical protein